MNRNRIRAVYLFQQLFVFFRFIIHSHLKIFQDFISEIVPIIAGNYEDLPDSILTHRDAAIAVLEKEERAFRQTLNKGLKEMHKMVKLDTDGVLDGTDLFKLQDTYGFPFEVSVEEAYRQNIPLSKDYKAEFDAALEEQRQRSKTASKGMFKGGLEDHGEMSTKYHTATHLTFAALRKVLGDDIHQQGSNITPERMRLDFNFDRKLTSEEKQAVEDQVNAWISEDLPVTFDTFDKKYAKDKLKAEGMFWDKYDDQVKVYTIGDFDNPVSREICGGPHVEHTGVLGHFKLKKEESSSAGVRRIKAILE
jgi:alanyl-tRNA synthetase